MTTTERSVNHAPAVWSSWQRVAFRFGFLLGVLYLYPLPFGFVPYTESVSKLLYKPLRWLSDWFADFVLGTPLPPSVPTGSGDTLAAYVWFLVIVILAGLGTIVWSVLDRKRTAYPRLAMGVWIALRYLLAWMLLAYGFAKLINTQFPFPTPARLDQRVGDLSPMGLLWTFQGYSTAYTFFGGLAEAVAGALLLWRRTATAGALLAIAVMTNVVMLNFCYDVPVKLFSSQLLAIAIVIAAPQLRRVIRAVLGHGVPDAPPRVRSSVRNERMRLIIKLVALVLIAYSLYEEVRGSVERRRDPHELHGVWRVESWQADHADVQAAWRKLIFTTRGTQIVTSAEERAFITAAVLPAARTVTVKYEPKPDQKVSLDIGPMELWQYTHSDADRLVIERVAEGKRLRITLAREPAPLLVTRGFHWIQEFPFNR